MEKKTAKEIMLSTEADLLIKELNLPEEEFIKFYSGTQEADYNELIKKSIKHTSNKGIHEAYLRNDEIKNEIFRKYLEEELIKREKIIAKFQKLYESNKLEEYLKGLSLKTFNNYKKLFSIDYSDLKGYSMFYDKTSEEYKDSFENAEKYMEKEEENKKARQEGYIDTMHKWLVEEYNDPFNSPERKEEIKNSFEKYGYPFEENIIKK